MKIDKNLSLSSSYSIEGEIVANFNAFISIDDEIDYQTNKNVNNQKIYRANKEEVNSAFDTFEDEVYTIVDKLESGAYETV